MPPTFSALGPLFRPSRTKLISVAARWSLDPLGAFLVSDLQNDLPGHFKKTVKRKFTGRGIKLQMVIFSNAPGIKYIEEGRDPGKQPPPAVLLKWVRRKGLGGLALSLKTRRALVVGITRTRERATGRLRTRAQSLLAKQKSIAFLIGRKIAQEGLPRNTGRRPSHALFLFRDLKSKHATRINATVAVMQNRVTQIINA
jgi:hypothetical protein